MTDTTYHDLKDKRVVVTGGASGIGAEVVRAFAAQGARVVFLDIAVAEGRALAASLGEGVSFLPVDLTDPDAITAAFETIGDAHGPVEVLVNGAANDNRHALDDVTPESWRNTLAVNLDHQFFCAQAVLPAMRAAGAGVIVNFGSIAWRVGIPNAVGYLASKAAIEGLTHALAREEGPRGIRVNCLLPGFVKTQRQIDKWLTPAFEAEVMAAQCLPEFIAPAEIAAVVLFLCSDASRCITNQTIVADAGWL